MGIALARVGEFWSVVTRRAALACDSSIRWPRSRDVARLRDATVHPEVLLTLIRHSDEGSALRAREASRWRRDVT